MKKKKILGLVLSVMTLTSVVEANECKIKVGYANNALDNKLGGTVAYVIHDNSVLTTVKKHMRKVINHGDHDVRVSYWDIIGKHKKTVKKGKTAWVSGDLKETRCLTTPKHKAKSYKLNCVAGNNMTVQYNRFTERKKGIKNRLFVTFKAAAKGTKYGKLNHGECSWVDRRLKSNEPKKFCHENIYDFSFIKNARGYALKSKKASYVDKLRIGGKFSLEVKNKNGCLVVTKVLP